VLVINLNNNEIKLLQNNLGYLNNTGLNSSILNNKNNLYQNQFQLKTMSNIPGNSISNTTNNNNTYDNSSNLNFINNAKPNLYFNGNGNILPIQSTNINNDIVNGKSNFKSIDTSIVSNRRFSNSSYSGIDNSPIYPQQEKRHNSLSEINNPIPKININTTNLVLQINKSQENVNNLNNNNRIISPLGKTFPTTKSVSSPISPGSQLSSASSNFVVSPLGKSIYTNSYQNSVQNSNIHPNQPSGQNSNIHSNHPSEQNSNIHSNQSSVQNVNINSIQKSSQNSLPNSNIRPNQSSIHNSDIHPNQSSIHNSNILLSQSSVQNSNPNSKSSIIHNSNQNTVPPNQNVRPIPNMTYNRPPPPRFIPMMNMNMSMNMSMTTNQNRPMSMPMPMPMPLPPPNMQGTRVLPPMNRPMSYPPPPNGFPMRPLIPNPGTLKISPLNRNSTIQNGMASPLEVENKNTLNSPQTVRPGPINTNNLSPTSQDNISINSAKFSYSSAITSPSIKSSFNYNNATSSPITTNNDSLSANSNPNTLLSTPKSQTTNSTINTDSSPTLKTNVPLLNLTNINTINKKFPPPFSSSPIANKKNTMFFAHPIVDVDQTNNLQGQFYEEPLERSQNYSSNHPICSSNAVNITSNQMKNLNTNLNSPINSTVEPNYNTFTNSFHILLLP